MIKKTDNTDCGDEYAAQRQQMHSDLQLLEYAAEYAAEKVETYKAKAGEDFNEDVAACVYRHAYTSCCPKNSNDSEQCHKKKLVVQDVLGLLLYLGMVLAWWFYGPHGFIIGLSCFISVMWITNKLVVKAFVQAVCLGILYLGILYLGLLLYISICG